MENLKLNPEAPIPELFMAIQNKINEIVLIQSIMS